MVKYLNKGIDDTRKKEVKTEPLLKKAKYVMLKNSEDLTDKERAKLYQHVLFSYFTRTIFSDKRPNVVLSLTK